MFIPPQRRYLFVFEFNNRYLLFLAVILYLSIAVLIKEESECVCVDIRFIICVSIKKTGDP